MKVNSYKIYYFKLNVVKTIHSQQAEIASRP